MLDATCGKPTTLFGGRTCTQPMTHLLDEKVVHSDGRMVWFEVPPEKMEPKFIGGDVSFSCRYCCTQLEALLDSEDSPAYGQAMCGTCRRVYKVEVTIVEEWISV